MMPLGARIGIALWLVVLLTVPPADGRGRTTPARVGMLRTLDDLSLPGTLTQNLAALKEGLTEHGWTEGRNLVMEYRSPRQVTDRLEDFARELVRLNVDVIHAAGPAAIRAAQAATATIPIVAHDFETDPVAAGFVASYARPGGNVTGMFLDLPEVTGKWLQLLRQVIPGLTRVAVLWDPATGDAQLRAAEGVARTLGLTLHVLEVRHRGELEARFRAANDARAGAVMVLSSPLFAGGAHAQMADLVVRTRLPSVTLFQGNVEAGGLMAYGPNVPALYRQEGRLIAKILGGARPADLPIERPARFELLVNMKTAKKLGVTIPPELMLRADRVIE